MLINILFSGMTSSVVIVGLGLEAVSFPVAEASDCEDTWAVKLNEFLANPSGSDSQVLEEWVELYNVGSSEMDLAGWSLEWGTTTYNKSLDLSGVIQPGGTFVISEALANVGADLLLPSDEKLGLGNASSNADAIRVLDCDGVVVDTVVYGGSNANGWLDDRGVLVLDTETGPKPGDNESIARFQDGADSEIAASDFCDDATPSPSNMNDCSDDTDPPDTGGTDTGSGDPDFIACESDLVINEFVPNPDGEDGGSEWVELYNSGSESVDLVGWGLEWGTKSFSSDVVFTEGSVEPGAFFLIGGEFISDADLTANLTLGNAGSSGDGLRLVCADGSVADTIIYGSNNDDKWVDDTGDFAESLAGKPGSDGTCLARIQDGYDTDASALDVHVLAAEECTPGSSNPFTPRRLHARVGCVCERVPARSRRHRRSARVGGVVQFESDTLRLDGWSIEIAKGSWGDVQFTFSSGAEIEGGGFLLIGGNEVVDLDYLAEDLDLGNAGSNGDGIRLVDCEGTVIDSVVYGENNDDGLIDDGGSIALSYSKIPGDDQSAGRFPDGEDSDQGGDDFSICSTPTPGEPNGDCSLDNGGGGNGGGGDNLGGCGCGSAPEGVDNPNAGGCSQAPRAYGSVWGFLGFVFLLRRRRRFQSVEA